MHEHADDHGLEPSNSYDTHLHAHFEDDGKEHIADEAEEPGDSERKSRRRSRSLGHLIGIEGLSIGSHSNKRSKHNRLLKHSAKDAGHKGSKHEEKVKNGSLASISSTTSHGAPSVLYLAALRAGERNNWIAQLRRYAQTVYSGTVERPLSSPVSAPLVFRVERCMWIKIHEVQALSKSSDSAIALVVIDGHVVAQSAVTTSTSKTKIEPVAHFFGSLPPITRGVHVLVRHKDKHAHGSGGGGGSGSSTGGSGGLMGYCQIPIPMLQRGCTYNGWYPLSHGNVSEIDQQIGSYLPLATNTKPAWRRWTSKNSSHSHADGTTPSSSRPSTPFRSGDVHIQVRYDELVVLSSPFYIDVVTLLLDARPTLIFDLVAVLPRSADWLVETTTKIAICNNRVVPWIEAIIQHELGSHAAVPDPALVFRGASVATRAMDTLMKVVGLTFLDQMIGNVVRDVAAGNYHCEVDPARINAKEDVNDHWRTLLHLQRALWLGIEESIDNCPPTMSRIFAGIRAVISQLYADHVAHDQVRYSCISGFLFLRLVCPAMLSPKTFGLVGTHPSPAALRTLTLLAKGIQCTANLTDFALKEPYMQPMNSFVQQSVPKLKRYIDHIAGDSADIVEANLNNPHTASQAVVDDERMTIMAVDRERELAAFSDFLYLSRDDIRRVIALSSPLHSSASSAISAASSVLLKPALSTKDSVEDVAMSPQPLAAELELKPANPDQLVADNTQTTTTNTPAPVTAFVTHAAEPLLVSSAALSETHRLIENLVQACESVQECVEACMQSPYATCIQTPTCSKESAV
ncbi:GTPase activating factor [Coemansia sp. RSA 2603]|nr:GTPase activating factor [Coemansia sp. RSA 2603]